MDRLSTLLFITLRILYVRSSWLDSSNIMAWQLNPQLYLLGATPKCTESKAELSPLQNAMCTSGGYQDHMGSVNVGLLMAVAECQEQFSRGSWNCSGVQVENVLSGLDQEKASKEDAFIHAVSSAGIAHAVARGCRSGFMSKCSCSSRDRPESLNNDFVWGGVCGDNIEYGYKFATAFVDLREKERNYPKGSEELGVMLMNKHNNEAGRRTVHKADTIACRCHGVTGSCTLKTCWEELSSFRSVGDRLKDTYDVAMKVQFNKDGTRLRNSSPSRRSKRKAAKEELIYLIPISDACQGNSTVGRICDRTSTGEDNCDKLCCERGYKSEIITVTEKCNCNFEYCCYVRCEECSRVKEQFVCL